MVSSELDSIGPGWFNENDPQARFGGNGKTLSSESLIMAQDERWRRALDMQVERPKKLGSGERRSNT